MSQPNVKVYSLSTCSHCKATKKFLGECTIKYEFIDVDKLEGDERKAIIADVKNLIHAVRFRPSLLAKPSLWDIKKKT